jgi:hypothetical protein
MWGSRPVSCSSHPITTWPSPPTSLLLGKLLGDEFQEQENIQHKHLEITRRYFAEFAQALQRLGGTMSEWFA